MTLVTAGCSSGAAPGATPRDAGTTHDGASVGDVVRDAPADARESGRDTTLLGPLPTHLGSVTERFASADNCVPCHAAREDEPALRDRSGRDVSPYSLWERSMMALSARDPYWLAAFSRERAENPAAVTLVERTCTRCHAPEGAVERERAGAHLSFDELVGGTSDEAYLAREGVGCTGCHGITAEGLGTPESFTGGYVIDDRRRLYGPHREPVAAPMERWVGFAPTHGDHLSTSALCATCHTVMTRALDARAQPAEEHFAEQVPYFEWQASDFRDEGQRGARAASCQACHMPALDDDGNAITSRIATRPSTLAPRATYGRHEFWGGNAYMLRVLARNAAWAGLGVSLDELEASAVASERNVRRAASVAVTSVRREGGALAVEVRVRNESGHKFPTAYPTRRAWLHVRVLDAGGGLLFESGRVDAAGALVDRAGRRLDGEDVVLPHRDLITREDEVQVYEGVPVDAQGRPTHALLRAVRWAKDDRLLPVGWSMTHPNARWTRPVGTDNDPNFTPGEDQVTYRVALGARAPARVEVALLFQTVTPAAVEGLAHADTPATRRFVAMVRSQPPAATVVATARADVTP